MTAGRDDWDAHWEEYGNAAAANPAQRYRHRLVLRELAAAGPPERLLDVGAGTGDLLALARQAFPGVEILGLDFSGAGLELAGRKVPDGVFVARDLLDGGRPAEENRGWATHAVCSEVIEHVDRPLDLLVAARDYLAPGCRLVVTVPGGPMSAFDRHIGHRRHFRPRDVARLLADAGFRVERAHAAGFPFFNLYRLAVIARGDRLAHDAASGRAKAGLARTAGYAFDLLFRLNLRRSRWGWQIVAVAVLRDDAAA